MELAAESLKALGNSALYAGLILCFAGGVSSLWMLARSTKRTRQAKTTKLDAMYLAYSAPGFSRFSLFNSPDNIGLGVYAALALEQAGATVDDIKPYIDVSLKLYPDWAGVYLSAARHYALAGDEQKARDFLSIARTVGDDQMANNDIPQIELQEVERIISSGARLQSTTSIDEMFEELRKKPRQLLLARSLMVALAGLGLLFAWAILYIASKFIT